MQPNPSSTRDGSIALQPEVAQILQELKAGLQTLYGERLRDVYLFGSYARGEEREGSDLDVLIVLDRVADRFGDIEKTGYLVSDLSLEHGVTISRAFVSEGDWLLRQSPFLINVRGDAIPA
jgi:type I restriction enzyme S subunit